jgi:N-acetylmuramoyl-L-alanine amidase
MFGGRSHPYSDRFHGYSIFVSASSLWATDSIALATLLGRALTVQGLTPSLHHAEAIPGENRTLLDPRLGIYRFDELVVLRGATMPALLLESGVIVNRDEEQAIQNGGYHTKVAAALVDAISEYCSRR